MHTFPRNFPHIYIFHYLSFLSTYYLVLFSFCFFKYDFSLFLITLTISIQSPRESFSRMGRLVRVAVYFHSIYIIFL